MTEVTLHFVGLSESKYLVDDHEVDLLVKASIELHHEPGINPHAGRFTSKIWRITARKLRLDRPFWWSTPGLGTKKVKGASIYWPEACEKVLWQTSFINYQFAKASEPVKERFVANMEL